MFSEASIVMFMVEEGYYLSGGLPNRGLPTRGSAY